jgi:hypothetical protein
MAWRVIPFGRLNIFRLRNLSSRWRVNVTARVTEKISGKALPENRVTHIATRRDTTFRCSKPA